jgi:hypothetical protein
MNPDIIYQKLPLVHAGRFLNYLKPNSVWQAVGGRTERGPCLVNFGQPRLPELGTEGHYMLAPFSGGLTCCR